MSRATSSNESVRIGTNLRRLTTVGAGLSAVIVALGCSRAPASAAFNPDGCIRSEGSTLAIDLTTLGSDEPHRDGHVRERTIQTAR